MWCEEMIESIYWYGTFYCRPPHRRIKGLAGYLSQDGDDDDDDDGDGDDWDIQAYDVMRHNDACLVPYDDEPNISCLVMMHQRE